MRPRNTLASGPLHRNQPCVYHGTPAATRDHIPVNQGHARPLLCQRSLLSRLDETTAPAAVAPAVVAGAHNGGGYGPPQRRPRPSPSRVPAREREEAPGPATAYAGGHGRGTCALLSLTLDKSAAAALPHMRASAALGAHRGHPQSHEPCMHTRTYSLTAFTDFCSSNFEVMLIFLFICLLCYACLRTRQLSSHKSNDMITTKRCSKSPSTFFLLVLVLFLQHHFLTTQSS